jgi:hypothetical protein
MKQEIDVNVAALKAYDDGDFDVALQTFSVSVVLSARLTALQEIADSSRIYFNMGMIHATVGRHEEAVFTPRAIKLMSRSQCTKKQQI